MSHYIENDGSMSIVPEKIPNCDICGHIQANKGALLFGPPNQENFCKKTHVCINCYLNLFKLLKNIINKKEGK